MHNINIIVCVLLLACSLNSYSQTEKWQVSSENAKTANPARISPGNVAAGKTIYVRTCIACHGEKADGKGLIPSTSLLTNEFQSQTDGTIFFKIGSGRNKMPPFNGVLKDDEIWAIINYLRILVNPSVLPPAKDLKIELTANEKQKTITAIVTSADSLKHPLSEIDVHFYIQRDFGLMLTGFSSNFTGVDGKVTVIFPEEIIGDLQGNVTIIGKIENSFLFNDATSSTEQKWGQPLKTEDDKFNKRALWGSREKSPVWLLLLANSILATVCGVIIYIILNLFRIKKAGKVFIK